MTSSEAPSLSQLCALHFASMIGNGRVPPIDTPLPAHIGDDIMDAMRQLSLLDERSLNDFAKTSLAITRFDSSGCGPFSLLALAKLQKYKGLLSINIASHEKADAGPPYSSLNIMQFVTHCLSDESAANLRHLNIAGYSKLYSINGFGKLPKLESLSVARRPICSRLLAGATKFFNQLRSLDISDTSVSDLTWLENLPNLEVLIMHNVDIKTGDVDKNLTCIQKLRVLDISKKIADYANDDEQESFIDLSSAFVDILKTKEMCPWPELRSVDMSGNALAGFGLDQAIQMVNVIIDKCPELKTVSVLATPLDAHSFPLHSKVNIMNCSTRENAMTALGHYWNTERDVFTSHALHAVYYCLQSSYDDFSCEEVLACAELVCKSMKRHLNNIGVQMAGSACLYHLCKMKRIRRLPSKLVQNCMNRCLDAAEAWRSMVQLQKNVWLTICNDYLLQLPGVDFYRTCKVALESMLTSKDSSVARMTIAIVSIVTPKMKPPEAKELVGDERYVKFLVGMLNENMRHLNSTPGPRSETSLFTLKFTLSALWNLTDESSRTCEVFHRAGGIATCFNILKNFGDHYNIQTKVLGILNNIAEVEELRYVLTKNVDYIGLLCDCLVGDFTLCDENGRNRAVERSYFAAGVLSNLLAHPFLGGEDSDRRKEMINSSLRKAVTTWPKLKGAMVSYKSFAPFARILKETLFDGAILWCLWGVLHVLSNNDKSNSGLHYRDMVKESLLPEICTEMANTSSSDYSKIRELATEILATINNLEGIFNCTAN